MALRVGRIRARWMWRHKWRWIIPVAVVVAVAGAGLYGRYVWVPSYRPGLVPGESYGIDVSGHQGHIDWSDVARSGLSFVYIKATEGSTYVDADFAYDLAAARAAGLVVGAYHFFTLCSPGASQAASFLHTTPPGSTVLPPAVDLELPGNCTARPSLSQVETQLSDFVDVVETATGQPVIFYIGTSFEHRYPIPVADNGLRWKRSILLAPPRPWVIWQVDGLAQIDGIDGPVDLDVMKMDDIHPMTSSPAGARP